MIEDAELLRRYATERSEEAFGELVWRHLGLVYGSALRRVNGNAALAEEVAQGVFASVAHEAAELEKRVAGGMALAGWLYVATRHAAANALRAEVRRVRREQEAFAMHEIETDGANGAGDAEVWAQVRPELETVMDELSEADRDAVLLRFFEGKAFGEIGEALRVSEDAARVRVNRALEKMRTLLARRGVTSTAAALGGLLAGNAAVAAPVGMAASVTGAALTGVATSAVAVGVGTGVGSAGAGVSAAGAGILSFMTTTKLVTGVACVVAALAVGTTVYERRAQEIAQTEVARLTGDAQRLTQRIDELERARTEAEEKAQAAAKELAMQQSLQKSASDASAKTGDVPSGQASTTAAAREKAEQAKKTALADGQEFIATSSQGRALLIDIGRVQIARTYASFYRMAKLSPAQIDEFENATNELWLSTTVLTPTSLSPERTDLSDEQARTILGEAGFAQFEQFRRMQPVHDVVTEISNLSPDAPLTRDQSEQLSAILTNASPAYRSGGEADPQAIDWNQVEAQARGVLTGSQLDALHAQSQFPALMNLMKEFYQNRAPTK